VGEIVTLAIQLSIAGRAIFPAFTVVWSKSRIPTSINFDAKAAF
jgi:hypothetical protein